HGLQQRGGQRGGRGHVDLEYTRRATATTTGCCRSADGAHAPSGEKESDDGGGGGSEQGRPAPCKRGGRRARPAGRRECTPGRGDCLPLPLRQRGEQALLRRRPQEGRLQRLARLPSPSPLRGEGGVRSSKPGPHRAGRASRTAIASAATPTSAMK